MEKNIEKNPVRTTIFLIIGLVVFQLITRAETKNGEVTAINQGAQFFVLKNPLEKDGAKILLRPDTKLEGIGSLKDLALGDAAEVDVVKNEKVGAWEANSVRISKVKIYRGG